MITHTNKLLKLVFTFFKGENIYKGDLMKKTLEVFHNLLLGPQNKRSEETE